MHGIYRKITISYADIEKAEKYLYDKNTSLLVIMFTDIQGSTSLAEKLGDLEFVKVLKEHDSTLLPIVFKHNGVHIKSIGDSIMTVFSKPSSAVECALEIQEKLNKYPPLKIRIGMDMGEIAEERADGVTKDVFGRFVNRAARIVNLAEGGHILVTDQIQDSAAAWISDDQVKWYNHGKHMVKGVEKPLTMWEPYNPSTAYPMQFKEIYMEQERKWATGIFRRPQTKAKLTHHSHKIAQFYVAIQQRTLEAWRLFDFQRDITMDIYVQEVLQDSTGFSPLGSMSKIKYNPPIAEKEILHWISGDIEKFDQFCIVVGRTGSGKSTMLRNWTLSLIAEHKKNITGRLLPVPIYLSLRHLSSSIHERIDGKITSSDIAKCFLRTIPAIEDKDAELLSSIIQNLRSKESISKRKSIMDLVFRKKTMHLPEWIFLCDGLDEMAKGIRMKLLDWIHGLPRSVRVVLATRPGILSEIGHLPRSKEYEICDFNGEQIQLFVTKWFYDNERLREALIDRIKSDKSLSRLAVISLLITCLCMDVEIFQNVTFPINLIESDLLQRVIEILMDRWDAMKEHRASNQDLILLGMKVFTELALTHTYDSSFQYAKLGELFNKHAYEIGIKQEVVSEFLTRVTTAGRILIGNQNYGFSFGHAIFFDYFFARGVNLLLQNVQEVKDQ